MYKLPSELCTCIAEQVASRNDLASLRGVSKYWKEVATPVLFHTLIIHAGEIALEELDSKPYESLIETSFQCLQLVRHFDIHAVFHEDLKLRCPHSKYPGGPYPWEFTGIDVLNFKLLPLLKQFKNKNLRSFRWELGCCVPKEILGIDGYLQREQPEIESLSLNTEPPADTDPLYFSSSSLQCPASLDLSVFKRLQNFSWTGLRMRPELESLRTILKANCEILRVLELDFIYWDAVRRAWTEQDPNLMLKDEDILNEYILPLSPVLMTSGFVALTNLSLTAVTLSSDPEATISAFDFGQLRSLRLHRCPHTPRLLCAIARAGLPIKLEVLDVVMEDTERTDDWEHSSLNAFLRSFDSLRRLYILIKPATTDSTDHFFESILCHSKNLRRLVYHEQITKETWYSRTTDKDLSWATTDFSED
ncbi:MAG: hypothetical protein Q9161_004342 [Pseudevernia consocians]